LLTRKPIFQSASPALIIAWFIRYGFYFFLRSEVVRPALTGTDALTRMIRDVYTSDHPYNDFPGLPTSLSTIIALHWLRVDRRLGIIVAIWTALIVASSILTKQHYVADPVSGLLPAFGADWLSARLFLRKP